MAVTDSGSVGGAEPENPERPRRGETAPGDPVLPKTRIELVRPYGQRILSPQRLPVPPLGPVTEAPGPYGSGSRIPRVAVRPGAER
jgi:hypothetical protein